MTPSPRELKVPCRGYPRAVVVRAVAAGLGRADAECVESEGTGAGEHFWARGYFVSTVGRDEAVIREQYIRKQEQAAIPLDQLGLWR